MPRGVNPLDEARLQGRLWTPALLGGDVRMWIAPRDPTTVTLDGSGRASAMRDLSPYRVDFTQSTTGSRPTYIASGALTGVANDASNWMIRDTGSAVTLNDLSLFMTVMWTGNGSAGFPAFLSAASDNVSNDFGSGFNVDRGSAGGTANPFNTMGIASPKDSSNTDLLADSIAYNSPTIVCARVRDVAGTQSITINGREQGLSRAPTTPAATVNVRVMRLFARFFSGAIQALERGVISEMFLVGRTMTPAEIRRGEGYAAWASGVQNQLDASHPFRNRPPLIGD